MQRPWPLRSIAALVAAGIVACSGQGDSPLSGSAPSDELGDPTSPTPSPTPSSTPSPTPQPTPVPESPPPAGTVAVKLELVTDAVVFPTALASPPGDATRLFIAERAGRIRLVRIVAGVPQPPTTVLDLTAEVGATTGERGLFSLAFHPDYPYDPRLFVSHTDADGHSVIASVEVDADTGVADPESRLVLLHVRQPDADGDTNWHNNGQLAFDLDGFLYVGMGDGGGPERYEQAQDPADLFGSLLRIDVDRTDGDRPYAIPDDNPLADTEDARPEVWSVGLRNPWRFSFDRETGDLYIGDVGENVREEINIAPAPRLGGENYGWAVAEGTACGPGRAACSAADLTPPVLEYDHGEHGGCSVTGGYVYRGRAIPDLAGHYFYGDYCGGWVRSFRYVDGQATEPRHWPALQVTSRLVSFGEDAAGELYILERDGRVYRIAPAP